MKLSPGTTTCPYCKDKLVNGVVRLDLPWILGGSSFDLEDLRQNHPNHPLVGLLGTLFFACKNPRCWVPLLDDVRKNLETELAKNRTNAVGPSCAFNGNPPDTKDPK